jgi:hypothetical protein
MDHVDVDDCVRPIDRPCVRRGRIEPQRRQQVRQGGMVAPGGNAGKGLRRGISRLPLQAGQGGSIVDGMLAGTGGDLQHEAAIGQAGF